MALTVCSLSPASVTPYHLLESRFHVHAFGSLHTPFSFLFFLHTLVRKRCFIAMIRG